MTAEPRFYAMPVVGRYRPCRACGVPLAFGKSDGGKPVPLDLSTLRLVRDPEDEADWTWEAQTHYQTCPEARRFTRQRSKKGGGDGVS